MSEKAANVQRETLKDLQKAWRTIAQDHFKRLQESLSAWKETERNEDLILLIVQWTPTAPSWVI